MKARINDLSVYIDSVEVDYLAFPRFYGSYCSYSSLTESCRERLDNSLKNAQEIVDRFVADGRKNASAQEIQKAFNRNR